jgi:AraC-like DNA-binding protein
MGQANIPVINGDALLGLQAPLDRYCSLCAPLGFAMPASRIFEFTDPEHYQTAIRASDIELFPTRNGEFFAELIQIDLNRLWLQRGSENLPTISRGVVTAEHAVIEFLTCADQPPFQRNGTDVAPGTIVVDDRRPAHRRCSIPHRWGSTSLTPADLAAAGRALAGRELAIPLVTRFVHPTFQAMARLLALHQGVAQIAKAAPETLAHPEVVRSLEHALVHAMIRCLCEGSSEEERSGVRQHAAVMARLEDFLAAHHDRSVYLAEICTAVGVSERMLRVCCHEQLGIGPLRFLWLRRMHFARRALIRADPGVTTVSEIAANHGFLEFGRFSVQYRALFGESPSVSLRRPPADRRVSQNRPLSLPPADFA